MKEDGDLMVRECVERKYLTKPLTAKLLDTSRQYWLRQGVTDWGIVVEKEGLLMNKEDMKKGCF